MAKTRIEWCNYSINPVKGLCPVDCKDNQGKSYCYARRMYKRFKRNPEVRFDVQTLRDIEKIKKPSRIFVGSTMELFGEWVNPEWLVSVFRTILVYPQHTFIFLTKRPENLPKEFPDNCWVGVSVPRYWDDTGHPEAFHRISQLGEVKASVKFVSFEPLLAPIASEFDFGLDMVFKVYGISWVIIGQQTPVKKATKPKIEWVEEIVKACDKAKIPVFLKNNLLPCWALIEGDDEDMLRQEFPCV